MHNAMSTPISIVIRASSEHRYSISTNHTDSVLDLKKKIALQDATPPERVRLVYSGRVLKDTNTLGSYKIADGHTIHLVRSPSILPPLSAPSSTTGPTPNIPMATSSPATSTASAASTTTSGAVSSHNMGSFPNLWAHTMRSNSGLGDLGGGASGRRSSPGNRDTMNPAVMTQMMQDPNFAQYMSSMLQNPRIIESMLALNPFLQAMGPQAGEMLRSSQFQAMISDPEMLLRVARMGSQLGCPDGARGANTTESVSPMSPTWTGTESTVGLSSSTATRATTTPTAVNEYARNGESPASHLVPNYWMQQVGSLRASLGVSSPSTVKYEPVGFEERYQVELKKLTEMGFWDAAKNVRALVASSGNLNGAIELLFSGSI